MHIRPVKTEADYTRTLAEIEQLWGAKTDTKEGDLLDVLLVLIEKYEEQHYPISPPDPVEAIKFRMEQEGLKQIDLAKYFGTKSRVSEVLAHKRELTVAQIRKLHKELNIPLESLVGV